MYTFARPKMATMYQAFQCAWKHELYVAYRIFLFYFIFIYKYIKIENQKSTT